MYKKRFTPTAIACATSLLTVSSAYANDPSPLDTVTVVASKQGINLQNIDSSVEVKTADELEKAGVSSVEDLQKVFPGLVIQTRGSRLYSNTTIRGISSPDYYSPTISVYVDGVKQDSAFLTQQLINVKQVELLKGPQGTLYGGNAQGAIINIVTNKASENKASARVTYSSTNQTLDASATGQLSESVFADINLRALKDEGFIDHLPSNTKDANDTRETSASARLHFRPSGGPFTASLAIATDKLDSHEEWYLTESDYNKKQTSMPIPELERRVNTYALTLGYDFGASELTSITAWQNRNVYRNYIGGIWHEDQDTFSQELRLNSQVTENLNTVVGAYYETKAFKGNASGAINDKKDTSIALFGQALYALTNNLDFTLGLRAERLKAESDYSGNPAWRISAYNVEKSESVLSPKVSLGWQASSNTRLFASITSGHRPGGFNTVPRSDLDSRGYDSENSVNGELGWRTTNTDNSFQFSGALYWIKTDDVQLYTGNIGSQALGNHGEAVSKGLELDIAYYPTDDLLLSLGATFGQSEFDSAETGLEGKTLPYAPDTTLVGAIEYYLPTEVLGGEWSLGSYARYNSRIYFDERNTLSQPEYTLVDLALTYQYDDRVTVKLFSNNVTDESYKTYSYASQMGTMSNYANGREFGIKVNLDW
ncbi:TonB-dependent receptor [Vibrio sonorensis]|uniref:TonB-dependent receptor n=1 Tax=Vibrio sonorensis TaxID=1004316 RepID=UPI0008D926BC|nr:TonB-dependent receptor [Vibrio sonorensis]